MDMGTFRWDEKTKAVLLGSERNLRIANDKAPHQESHLQE